MILICWCFVCKLYGRNRDSACGCMCVCVCVWVCVCVCLSVASHISETSHAIAVTFDTVTVSVMTMHQVSSFVYLEWSNSTIGKNTPITHSSVCVSVWEHREDTLTFISFTASMLVRSLNSVVVSVSPSTQATQVPTHFLLFFNHSHAAIPTSSKICHIIFLSGFFSLRQLSKQ